MDRISVIFFLDRAGVEKTEVGQPIAHTFRRSRFDAGILHLLVSYNYESRY